MEALISMGFDAISARVALDRTGGNVDLALDLLLSGEPLEASGINEVVHHSCSSYYLMCNVDFCL